MSASIVEWVFNAVFNSPRQAYQIVTVKPEAHLWISFLISTGTDCAETRFFVDAKILSRFVTATIQPPSQAYTARKPMISHPLTGLSTENASC
ncbi:hypothetical protein [Massilia litorea]|uniref:Uncharacterized protein n=1 Tax=Massilia litorea TaxID=2769491 RepID=A0A7L9U731_9BURK|nr:hypothetical protein [Massilia litorea]QOL50834.1 hypothetical protein LPB04_05985 [Massilia litorea]